MNKYFVSSQNLLEDSYQLGWNVYNSDFHPTHVIGIWRGGAPIAIAVHELLGILGVECDHFPVKISSYKGPNSRFKSILIGGLKELVKNIGKCDRLLIVDDVHDTGMTLDYFLKALQSEMKSSAPETRIATVYFKPNNNKTKNLPNYFLHKTDDWIVFPHELQGLSINELEKRKPEISNLIAGIKKRA